MGFASEVGMQQVINVTNIPHFLLQMPRPSTLVTLFNIQNEESLQEDMVKPRDVFLETKENKLVSRSATEEQTTRKLE